MEVISDPLRFEFAYMPRIKVVGNVVAKLPVKFGDHRRWSDRRRVGLTRSHFGRRVAVRPASDGGAVWPVSFSFSIRTTFVLTSF